MQDESKSQFELIQELEDLRSQVADLRSQVEGQEGKLADQRPDQDRDQEDAAAAPRSRRRDLQTQIQVLGDFSMLQARGVNVSDDGICFELMYDLPFEIQFDVDGQMRQYRAHLMWMRQLSDGRNQFGFKFVASDSSPFFELLS